MSSKLTISIPTRNRPKSVQSLLNNYIKNKSDDFRIWIFDSSDNNETEEIVNTFINKDASIKYTRFKEDYHFFKKSFDCLSSPSTEFVMLCGDRLLFTEDFFIEIPKLLKDQYDLIVMTARDNKHIGRKEYDDVNAMFSDNAWDMTLYGSTIFRKSLMKKVDTNRLFERYTYFFHIGLCYESLIECANPKMLYYPFKFRWNSKEIKNKIDFNSNEWVSDPYAVFGRRWIQAIESFPTNFDSYKKKVIKDHGIYSELFTIKRFSTQRMLGQLTYKRYKEYNDIWCKVTNVNKILILLISITPRGILKAIHFFKHVKEKL